MFKNLTLKTSVIQAFCFAASGAVSGFAMVTLLSKGLTSTQVGILLAASGALSAVIQPLLGSWADKSEKVSPRLLLIAIVSSIIVLLLAFIFLPSNLLLMSLIYGIASALLLSLQPLINSLVFEYINSGHSVNFGIGRGVGSLAYALSSFALGALLNIYKPSIIPYAAVITLIFLLLSILAMPAPPKKTEVENSEVSGKAKNSDTFGFIKKYQHFLFFLLGIVFIFIFQSLSNGYLLQILRHVGGNDSDLGTTLFLTAMSELPVMMAFSFIASKIKIETLLKFSALMFMIRSILMLFAGSVLMVNLVQLLQALSFALLIPAAVYYVNHRMEAEDQVKGQAFVMSACTVGNVLAFLSGGWLIEQFSVPIMLLVGAVAGIAGFICFIYSVRKRTEV